MFEIMIAELIKTVEMVKEAVERNEFSKALQLLEGVKEVLQELIKRADDEWGH